MLTVLKSRKGGSRVTEIAELRQLICAKPSTYTIAQLRLKREHEA